MLPLRLQESGRIQASRAVLIQEADQNKPGEIWAIAISADGQYLAGSSINGKINVWSLNKAENMPKIREYETKGSFGLCVDLVRYIPRSLELL
jgi:WD40 repeat protein